MRSRPAKYRLLNKAVRQLYCRVDRSRKPILLVWHLGRRRNPPASCFSKQPACNVRTARCNCSLRNRNWPLRTSMHRRPSKGSHCHRISQTDFRRNGHPGVAHIALVRSVSSPIVVLWLLIHWTRRAEEFQLLIDTGCELPASPSQSNCPRLLRCARRTTRARYRRTISPSCCNSILQEKKHCAGCPGNTCV